MGVDLRKLKRAVRKLGERVERERGQRRRTIAGAAILLAIFAAVAFSTWKLGFDVLVALAGGAAAALACSLALWPKPKVVVPLLVVAILIAGAGVLWPRTVKFKFEGSFTYRGSADNRVLENIQLGWLFPHVENQWPIRKDQIPLPSIACFYIDENNVPHQIREKLSMVVFPATIYGPYAYFIFSDNFHPREMFSFTFHIEIPKEKADKLTLRASGDKFGRGLAFADFEGLIDLEFKASLSKEVAGRYETIELFSRTYDNGEAINYWLYAT